MIFTPLLDEDSLGKRLVAVAVQLPQANENLDNIRVSIFAILRAESTLLTEGNARQKHLDLLIATFITFYGASGSAGELNVLPFIQGLSLFVVRREMADHISAIIKVLAPDEYSRALHLVSESLTSGSLEAAQLEIVVHLAILLLRGHPQRKFGHCPL
jgi:hypothetical protein